MNLVSVAERVAAIERSRVVLNAQRCLHATDRFSACAACQSVCPVAAIEPGRPPTLNAEACTNCLACLPVCPTGAFGADDAVAALLDCAARIETPTLELICQRHPRPAEGLTAVSKAVRVRGCLAGLGVGAYVALAALGVEAVVVRADGCADCAWGTLRGQLERQVTQAQQLLAPWNQAHKLSVCVEPAQAVTPRPVLEADNPPLSRRDLFRMAARRGQVMLARAVNDTGSSTGPHPARERQRVINALAALPARSSPASDALPAGPGCALVAVSAACSACAACARACPTGALVFERVEPDGYRLAFHPQRCNGCEACRRVCAPGAISLNPRPSFEAVFGQPTPQVLSAGALVRCQRCSAWTAAAPGRALCPTCAARRHNPFGARPIPALTKVQHDQ
jgi:ferredoxin